MPTINISDESYAFLKELYTNLISQSSRGTSCPYFVVQTNKKIRGLHPDYGDDVEYVDMSGHSDFQTFETKKEAIDSIIKDYGYTKEESETFFSENFEKFGYCYETQDHNFFLTEKGYQDHMALNSHNYPSDVSFYVHCAFRNPEYDGLIKAIKEIGKGIYEE